MIRKAIGRRRQAIITSKLSTTLQYSLLAIQFLKNTASISICHKKLCHSLYFPFSILPQNQLLWSSTKVTIAVHKYSKLDQSRGARRQVIKYGDLEYSGHWEMNL